MRHIITWTPKTKRSIIPTNLYFEFYGTGYINEHNYKSYIIIDKRSEVKSQYRFDVVIYKHSYNKQHNLSRYVQVCKYEDCYDMRCIVLK